MTTGTTERTWRTGVLLVVCLMTTTTGIGIVGVAGAADTRTPGASHSAELATVQEGNSSLPATADGYVAAFNALEGRSAYQSFSEFEVVRSQADLETQIGSFDRADQRKMGAVLRLLRTFSAAYQAEQNGSYQQALERANRTDSIATNLSNNGGEQYAVLADVALDRFYERIGERLLGSAEQQNRTPTRIQALSRAATAFERGGATNRFSQLTLRITNLSERYQRDRAEMNTSIEAATSFVDSCSGCGTVTAAITQNPLSVFASYSQSRAARAEASETVALADKHGLSDIGSDARSTEQQIGTYQDSLAKASVALVGGFALVVALVTAIVTNRLVAWRRDLEDSNLGDVVLMGEMLDV